MKDINLKQVITPVSDLRKKPDKMSELETQCLLGENLILIEKKNDWGYCKCELDNYYGWINLSELGEIDSSNYKINTLLTHVYSEPDMKSNILYCLHFNSKVSIIKKYQNWSKVSIGKNDGYIFNRHITKLSNVDNNFVRTSKLFLNTPYLWGGKTCLGIDCSGLVQIVLHSAGIYIPRNTSEQQSFTSERLIEKKKVEDFCLIFWKGHVAISIEKNKIIHSNAYHMSVIIEPLDEAITRIKNSYGDIIVIKKIIV